MPSLCCVEILVGETPSRKGQLSKQNGDRKTSNEIPPPARCDDISVYLQKSSVLLSSSGSVILEESRIVCGVLLLA